LRARATELERDFESLGTVRSASGEVTFNLNLGVKNAFGGYATGINNASQVVGIFYFIRPAFTYEAFVYQNGVMAPLGYPVPGRNVHLSKRPINQFGRAYRSRLRFELSGDKQCGPNNRWKFHYQNGGWQDLNTLIEPGSGWTISYAAAINNEGVIAGTPSAIYKRRAAARATRDLAMFL
jgi:probable HAF family extracellular repeat protein